MIDNFKTHSDDWSKVPRREAPGTGPLTYQVGYISAADIRSAPVVAPAPAMFGPPVIVQVAPRLSVGVAYIFWLLFGLLGAHYFYMGKIGVGVLYLLTGGLLGIGWLIDVFTIKGQVERINRYGR